MPAVKWQYDDQMGSRGRQPACIVVGPTGECIRFRSSDIPGLVKVLATAEQKNGKWSHTTYTCASPEGTSTFQFRQSFEEGVYWPEASWEDAIARVQKACPHVDPESLKALIRSEWSKAAEKFDENAAAIAEFGGDEPTVVETVVVTRHPALVEHLKAIGLCGEDDIVIAHATGSDVRGRRVVGVLPLTLACQALTITEVPLDLPAELRGVELTAEQVRHYAGPPETYRVERISPYTRQ